MGNNQQELINKCIAYVKEELAEGEKGHDWWHIDRVWRTSRLIAKSEPVDLFVVELDDQRGVPKKRCAYY